MTPPRSPTRRWWRRSATAGRQRRRLATNDVEWGIVAVDAAAILLFVTIGQLSHHGGVSATGYAEDALPFLAAWFAAFAVFGGRFLPTWLVGITLGVALRAVILSHYRWNELAFWLVSLAFVGGVAFIGRVVVRRVLTPS